MFFASALLAQTPLRDTATELLPRPLKYLGTKALQVPAFSSYGEAHCDDNASMYYHLAEGSYRHTRILRFTQSGRESTLYQLPEEFAASTAFMDFSVTPDGNVKALVEDEEGHSLVFDFDSDGNVSHHVRLDIPEDVTGVTLSEFPNGTLLFSGYYRKNVSGDMAGKRYEGLFQASGKLLKRLGQGKDDAKVDFPGVGHLQEGGAAIGRDGNIYLLSKGKVLVISSSGQVERTIPFSKPDSEFSAVRVQYSEGLLVISFAKPGNPETVYRYLVMNAWDGTVVGLYEPTEETGNTNVCFTRHDGFVFFKEDGQTVSLISAGLR